MPASDAAREWSLLQNQFDSYEKYSLVIKLSEGSGSDEQIMESIRAQPNGDTTFIAVCVSADRRGMCITVAPHVGAYVWFHVLQLRSKRLFPAPAHPPCTHLLCPSSTGIAALRVERKQHAPALKKSLARCPSTSAIRRMH